VVFVGKYAKVKGLPWLLEAVDRLRSEIEGIRLDVVGAGSGDEAERLATRMEALSSTVFRHGLLSQVELARLLRKTHLCILPSLYEGLPLVLVEALACGCRAAATALPGVVDQLAPVFGDALELIPMPSLAGPDSIDPREASSFVAGIETALVNGLARPPLGVLEVEAGLDDFSWEAVFRRVEAIWLELLELTPDRLLQQTR
jgi:glycosyltransferase involved in cell wall biosynthesis